MHFASSSDQSNPSEMTAIEINHPGGPEVLVSTRRSIPTVEPRDVLIRVHAAGVNFPDVLQRQGLYNPPPGASDFPGLEVAGEVVVIGTAVERFAIGDRVMALMGGGGYAEFAVADERATMHLPEVLDYVEGAALMESFLTVWMNVFQRGQFKAGETLLIHGGASGIGTTATMLGRAFGASRIVTTIGNAQQAQVSMALGADVTINYHEQDFVEATLDATDGKGADVIVDIIAGDYVARNYAAAALNGRIVQIGFIKGPAEQLDFRPMLLKRLTHSGSTLRARTEDEKAAIIADLEAQVLPHIRSGAVKPFIFATFDLADAREAHELMDFGHHIGKIVLKTSSFPV